MHVILEVESAAAAGQKRFLRAGETLEVGRSGLLDFTFQDDAKMSGRHFRIVTTRDTCHIEDLESTNGTEVNGQRVGRAPLSNNDKIVAGNTRFVVHVEGARQETVVAPNSETGIAVEVPVSANYVLETCKSGLKVYRGSASTLAPKILTKRLNQKFKQILIVVKDVLDPERAKAVGKPKYLFDWLPEETRAAGSPWMITAPDVASRATVIADVWGKDALVCVYSAKDKALPMDQLRRCAGTYVRPSVLRPQMSETAVEVAKDLMLEIEMVLVEDEGGESWLLYSNKDLQPLLAEMGLKKAELEQANGGTA